jgi:predicted transcriptional regulator
MNSWLTTYSKAARNGHIGARRARASAGREKSGRRTDPGALAHPRRERIYAYVQERPGTTFREVTRAMGLSPGTARHHIAVLKRDRFVVEHRHQSTVRLFENHGKYDHSWSRIVLLREPALGMLYDWLCRHQGSTQKDVLAGMQEVGWSRSTTQHRLLRLALGRLVECQSQGRFKFYRAMEPASQPGSPATGPVTTSQV